MQRTVKKPSRWLYLVGAAVIVLGFAGAALYGLAQASRLLPDVRVVAPGIHEVQLPSAGKYTVFYECNSVVDGHTYATGESLPRMSIDLTAKDTSQPVELFRPVRTTTYAGDGYSGRTMLEFKIDDPGTYVFTAQYDQGIEGPDVVFAIGQDHFLGSILVCLLILFGGLIIGILIVVVTLMKRHLATK